MESSPDVMVPQTESQVSVIVPKQNEDFVETPYVRDLVSRSLDYIKVGFPIHYSGPAGVGKTTLALHVASLLNRPVVLISGDHEFNTSDLVGGMHGYSKKFVRDNFIHSVLKIDETATSQWVDNRLTVACQNGFTLIYDEFTRSKPEANNILLSVLEEGILPLPAGRDGESYLKVHPNFASIFTSNPEEYAGVYKSQDALRDRMISLELGNFDEETEIAITQSKSKLSRADARSIVSLVRKVRSVKFNKFTPTIRACIMIGKILKLKGMSNVGGSETFRKICLDILTPEVLSEERDKVRQVIESVVKGERLKHKHSSNGKHTEEKHVCLAIREANHG